MTLKRNLGLKAAMLAGCALIAIDPAQAFGQTRAPTAVSIPSQDLGSALTQLGRDSGREIIFSTDLVRGLRAPSVSMTGEAEQILSALLAQSGLTWRRAGSGALVVERGRGSADAGDTSTLEEVVVTAQRREERGQDVPVAVTAFGRDSIDAYRLESLRDVSRLTPGLLVSAFNQSSPTVAIRGANNTFTQVGANKPVQVVLDDVFIPRNSAVTFELFGLNSIQVLKGPQGTLFGRNVTGGVILLDTGQPQFAENAARVRGTVGDYGLRAFEGLTDLALNDRVSVRLAGAIKQRDGFGEDRLTGAEQDDLDSASVRGQLRVQVTPTLEALIGADYADDRNGGRTLSSKGVGNDGDRRTSELGQPQRFARTQGGVSARLYWDVLGGEVTSITAWRQSQSGELYSGVGANYRFLTGTQSQAISDDADDVGSFTQELRFASPLWDRGNFILGAFYSDEDADRILKSQAFAAGTGALVTNQVADQSVESRSLAVFADGTVHLPADLDLTLGVRYTEDRKRASLIRSDLIRPVNGFSGLGLEREWSEITPRAVLNWKPTTDILAYVSYARGYTAGGFNTEAATLAALTAAFDPETVDNTELGLKTDWLDNRLRVNLAVFRLEYQDKQELFFNNVTRVLNITNAAEATVEGGEAEVRFQASDWLTLNATYGRLESQYDAFVIPGGATYTGNALGSSPEEKVSFSADARAPLGGWGEVFGTAIYSRTSAYNTGAAADPNLVIPAYDLVNLSAGIEPADGRWRLTAFVRNLEDTEYVLTPSTQTVLAEYLGEPRTAGVSLDWRF